MRLCTALLLVAMAGCGLFAESVAGVSWTGPAGWKSEGSRPMRAATYLVQAASGDQQSAECAVYFFGAGQGGSVQANIERWESQFQGPDGKVAPARVATATIHGLRVTTIDTSGAYSGLAGPAAGPASGSPVVQGYRLLGAIVEGPGGNVFVKFTGPSKTMAANQTKFEQLVASFQKAS